MTPNEVQELTEILTEITPINLSPKGNDIKHRISKMITNHHATYVPKMTSNANIIENRKA